MAKAVRAKGSKARTPRWRELRAHAKALRARLPPDPFPRDLIAGAFAVGRDKANPIRGNLFAAAMRELVTYVLHTLAPDTEVSACAWFKPEPNTNGPTRNQRATYIAQAGLAKTFVANELKLDIGSVAKPLIEAMDRLNKLTHLKPHSVLADDKLIRRLAGEVFEVVEELLKTARTCREAVARELTQHIDRTLFDSMISDMIDDLDILSTHTTVEGQESEEIVVVRMDHELIGFAVSGQVHARLQYGSNSDVRNDIGAVTYDSYPYAATLEAKVTDPTRPLANTVRLEVDNSSFYE